METEFCKSDHNLIIHTQCFKVINTFNEPLLLFKSEKMLFARKVLFYWSILFSCHENMTL